MGERELAARFHEDPLLFLDEGFPSAGDALWLPGRQLAVADAVAGKAVLLNAEGLYEDHSDFFHTRDGRLFGPRPVQVKIDREALALLHAHVVTRAGGLAESIQRALVPTSEWPDAGNWLMYRHLADALISPGSPESLRRTVDAVVERAVLAGARQRSHFLRRAVFRLRAYRELRRAVEQRRQRGAQPPQDLLDVVVGAAEPDVPADDVVDIFLSFVFAMAGSVGFVLGWSLYLLGTHPPTDAEPEWVVREALRLWPVAWMLASKPARSHAVANVAVTPEDSVVVCPYAVHRNPRHWEAPDAFRPERWADEQAAKNFLPFGWGPHKCPAGSLSMDLVADALRHILEGHTPKVTPRAPRPFIGPALAPPRFTLELVPRPLSNPKKGGD